MSTGPCSLSHSVSTRSRRCDRASSLETGNGLPSTQSGSSMPAMRQNVCARSTWPTGDVTVAGVTSRRRRRSPDQRQAHQRIAVIRPFEQQPVVALQFAVVGGEQHVGVVAPAAPFDAREHAAARVVDQFVLDVVHRVDLAHLVRSQIARTKAARRFQIASTANRRSSPASGAVCRRANARPSAESPRIQVGQRHVAPVHARTLRCRRIPRMVRIGKTEPHEPVGIRRQTCRATRSSARATQSV